MSGAALERMGAEAFLEWAEGREGRYELVDGVPQVMTGARAGHDRIVVNAVASLQRQLRGRPCRPFTGDLGVLTGPGRVRRPDVGIDCGPGDAEALAAVQPRLVLELLSRSTRQTDIILKTEEYKAVPTLDAILLAEPASVQVLGWLRGAQGWSAQAFTRLEETIVISGLGVVVSLAELYEDVPMPPRRVTPDAPSGR